MITIRYLDRIYFEVYGYGHHDTANKANKSITKGVRKGEFRFHQRWCWRRNGAVELYGLGLFQYNNPHSLKARSAILKMNTPVVWVWAGLCISSRVHWYTVLVVWLWCSSGGRTVTAAWVLNINHTRANNIYHTRRQQDIAKLRWRYDSALVLHYVLVVSLSNDFIMISAPLGALFQDFVMNVYVKWKHVCLTVCSLGTRRKNILRWQLLPRYWYSNSGQHGGKNSRCDALNTTRYLAWWTTLASRHHRWSTFHCGRTSPGSVPDPGFRT